MTITKEEVDLDHEVKLRVAAEIRSWLGRRRLSQEWLADAIGVGRTAIVKKLRGEQGFSLTQLVVVADRLDITLGQLLGEELLNEKTPRQIGGGSMFLAASDGISNWGSHDYESCALTS